MGWRQRVAAFALAGAVALASGFGATPAFAATELDGSVSYIHSCPQCNGLPHGLEGAAAPGGGYYTVNVAFLAEDLFGDTNARIASFETEGNGACFRIEKTRLPGTDDVEQDAISVTATDAPGEAVITVTSDGGATATCRVTAVDHSSDADALAAATHFKPVDHIDVYFPSDNYVFDITTGGDQGYSVGYDLMSKDNDGYVAATWENVDYTSSDESVLRFTDDAGSFEIVGTGEATITVTCNDPLNGNVITGTSTIKVVEGSSPEMPSIIDVPGMSDSSSVIVSGEGEKFDQLKNLMESEVLQLEVQKSSDISEPQQHAIAVLGETRDVLDTFDINLVDASTSDIVSVSSGDGLWLTVRIPLTEAMAAENPENLVVYYLSPDGSMHEMETFVENGYLCFVTDHLSTYAVTTKKSVDEKPQEEEETERPNEEEGPKDEVTEDTGVDSTKEEKREAKSGGDALAKTGDPALAVIAVAATGSIAAFAGAAAHRRRG